jgi:hypothetical protein
MSRTITKALLTALAAELIVLGIAAFIANDTEMFWQHAARYSARVSFVILAGLLLYTAIHGLLTISKNESKRKILRALIYLFVANHIIHLIYLAANQAVRNKILFKLGNIPGMIAYIVVLLLPLLLNRGLLSRGKQTMLLVSLLLIGAFFIQTYIGRVLGFSHPPDASGVWLYAFFASFLSLLALANLYRHIRESKAVKLSLSATFTQI